MDFLTIGKMAKMNGVSEQTLRLYDRMGLLVPSKVNKETGYRYYHIRQCAKLDMIQYMKSLDMSLARIKECFDSEDGMVLRSVLDEQKESIQNQIRQLRQADWAVERAIESYRRYGESPKESTVFTEHLDERYAFVYDTEVDCYSYDMDQYETVLRNLKKQFDIHNLPVSYFCNAGSILKKEKFISKELEATEILFFVDDSFKNEKNVRKIPEGTYMCLYCRGFDKEEDSLKLLMESMENSEYIPAGDCISEVMIEFPALCNNVRDVFLKLQIPVKKKE